MAQLSKAVVNPRLVSQLRPEEVDPVLAEHAFWETHGADPAVHVRYGSDVPGSVFGLAAAGDRHVQPPAPSTPPMANAASSSCSEPFTVYICRYSFTYMCVCMETYVCIFSPRAKSGV